ncbi:MAG: signal peptidase I [Acidimicrobiales bacterium]
MDPQAGSTSAPTDGRRSRGGLARYKGLLELPIIAALAVVIVVVLRALVVQPFYIPSASMVPQLQVNDKIVVSRLSYRIHRPRRGDVIVFDRPPGAALDRHSLTTGGPLAFATRRLGLVPRTDEFVKRVVGLPGEIIEGRSGHVYVNGALLVEPYLRPGLRTEPFAVHRVPAGQLWVMGDNRGDSEDSRFFGTIRTSTIVGRAILKVWPVTRVSFL